MKKIDIRLTAFILTLLFGIKCGISSAYLFDKGFAIGFAIVATAVFVGLYFTYLKLKPESSIVVLLITYVSLTTVLFTVLCIREFSNTLINPEFKPILLLFFVDFPFLIAFYFIYIRILSDKVVVKGFFKSSFNVFTAIAISLCTVLLIEFTLPAVNVALPAFQTFELDERYDGIGRTGYTASDYYGTLDGKNLVIIQLSGISSELIGKQIDGKELLPTINALTKDSLYLDNFFAQREGSIQTLFTVMNSLYSPLSESRVLETATNSFNGMAQILNKSEKMNTTAILPFDSNFFGYDSILNAYGTIDIIDFDNSSITPVSDSELYNRAIEKLETGGKDSVLYLIPTTCGNSDEYSNLQSYITAAAEADKALGEFIDSLKKNGLYDDTAIVAFGTPSGVSRFSDKLTDEYTEQFGSELSYVDAFRVPLFIHSPRLKAKTVSTLGSTVDIMPTILDLWSAKDDELYIVGDNLLADSDIDRIFLPQMVCTRTSYITDEYVYIKTEDERITTHRDGSSATILEIINHRSFVTTPIKVSEFVLDKNLFATIESDGYESALSNFIVYAFRNDLYNMIPDDLDEEAEDFYYLSDTLLNNTTKQYIADKFNGSFIGTGLTAKGLECDINSNRGFYTSQVITVSSKANKIIPLINGSSGENGKITLNASLGTEDGFTEWFPVSDSTGSNTSYNIEKDSYSVSDGIISITDSTKLNGKMKYAIDISGDAYVSCVYIATDASNNIAALTKDEHKLEINAKENAYDTVLNYYMKDKFVAIDESNDFSTVFTLSENKVNTYIDFYTISQVKKKILQGVPLLAKTADFIYVIYGFDTEGIYCIVNGKEQYLTNDEFEGVFMGQVKAIICGDSESSLTVITNFIPATAIIRPGKINNDKKYIVIHNTGNYEFDADAKSHAEYLQAQALSDTPREASWHYTVDDKLVYYHIPDNENAWHASDGSYGDGNYYGIGIEICVNGFPETYSGPAYEAWEKQFREAMSNAAKLTASLMCKYGLDMSSIKQHYDFAPDKKNCPQKMRYTPETGGYTRDDGKLWKEFIAEVEALYKRGYHVEY
ncbi:MAG: hypothetical protein A2Y17_06560 [Clostridiales bacterium GWF2_38_85]|nr:MAG: hypothetical protein A2Y17_06560 [Clostridiales bacterium GWF2_38_85]HBL84876.1 hypothetical protein [Clostridiales bacterium]